MCNISLANFIIKNIPTPLKGMYFTFFSNETSQVVGEADDDESVAQFAEAEADVGKIFFEAKANEGRISQTRRVLPVALLFKALNWMSSFRSEASVMRGHGRLGFQKQSDLFD